jgi:hypothetical protein
MEVRYHTADLIKKGRREGGKARTEEKEEKEGELEMLAEESDLVLERLLEVWLALVEVEVAHVVLKNLIQ